MKPYVYQQMHSIERSHWWFCARRVILKKFLEKLHSKNPIKTILEVGCGTGGNLDLLKQYGNTYGLEPSEETIPYLKDFKNLKQGSLPHHIPFPKNQFDFILAADVIEHIQEDQESLAVLHPYLKKDGSIILTVPAFPFLWGNHDKICHHKRRYTQKTLKNIINQEQYEIKFIAYFQFFLFPLIVFKRIILDKVSFFSSNQRQTETQPPRLINQIFKSIFSFESKLLDKLKFPFGSSIICVLKKK